MVADKRNKLYGKNRSASEQKHGACEWCGAAITDGALMDENFCGRADCAKSRAKHQRDTRVQPNYKLWKRSIDKWHHIGARMNHSREYRELRQQWQKAFFSGNWRECRRLLNSANNRSFECLTI